MNCRVDSVAAMNGQTCGATWIPHRTGPDSAGSVQQVHNYLVIPGASVKSSPPKLSRQLARQPSSQKARQSGSALVLCWAYVSDVGPTKTQRWAGVCRFLRWQTVCHNVHSQNVVVERWPNVGGDTGWKPLHCHPFSAPLSSHSTLGCRLIPTRPLSRYVALMINLLFIVCSVIVGDFNH